MKTVTLVYFAVLRECAGKTRETCQTNAESLRQLYDELRELYEFPLDGTQVRVAIGEAYCKMEDRVENGSEITYIPPVSGG